MKRVLALVLAVALALPVVAVAVVLPAVALLVVVALALVAALDFQVRKVVRRRLVQQEELGRLALVALEDSVEVLQAGELPHKLPRK